MSPRRSPLAKLAAVLCAAVTLVACSSNDSSDSSAPDNSPAPMATPLVGSVLAAPVPVPMTDGRTHLAYELMVTNTLSGNATMNSLTARSGDRNLLTLAGNNLKYWTRILGARETPTNVLAPGQTAIIWLDVVLEGGTQAPADLTHSVEVSVTKPVPGLIADKVTQPLAPVTVSTHHPVSIAPPLDGPNWLNANGCCDTTSHRMAVNPINAQFWVSERFAGDYVQLGDNFRLFTGDATKVTSYPYYGAPVHAVGEGKVVSVMDNQPDQVPGKLPVGLALDQYGGNHIVQDLGDGNYAFYAHLKPGSISVKPGDKLTAGQSIGAVGNTGNTDAPHLHFHVMDNPNPLAANGLPFVVKSFQLTQRVVNPAGLDAVFNGQPAPLQPGFATMDETEVSPLGLDIVKYAVTP